LISSAFESGMREAPPGEDGGRYAGKQLKPWPA
jgi:hypothetical protein